MPAAKKLRRPSIARWLKACAEVGEASFIASLDGLELGYLLGSGTLLAVQAGTIGDDEPEQLAELRAGRCQAFLVTTDGKDAWVRSKNGADVQVKEDETILGTWFRIMSPGERRAAPFRIPGTGIDVELRDGQIAVGSERLGALGAMSVPKDTEMKAIADRFWNAALGRFSRSG